MRAVFDTNVVLSGAPWGGKPALLLQAAYSAKLMLFTSKPMLQELQSVLSRPKMLKKLASLHLDVGAVLNQYLRNAQVVEILAPVQAAAAPDDDKVLAAAEAAYADFIVSGDWHLLMLERFRGIPIFSVTEALARIGSIPPI